MTHEMIGYVKDGWVEYYCTDCDKKVRQNLTTGERRSYGGDFFASHFGSVGGVELQRMEVEQ